MLRKFLIFPYLLLPLLTHAQSEDIIISGYVTDVTSGEPVEGASVFIEESSRGGVSDSRGYYTLTTAPGRWTIAVSHVSCGIQKRSVNAPKSTVANFSLEATRHIEQITVSSRAADSNVTGVLTGVQTLDIEQIRRLPALLGEVDVIKAIQMLPGVQMTSEGGSGFSVRGGSPDQNLILLDDAIIYNPSHLMGFFSIFNNDFVSSAALYKGDMPLRYGGRLSSLLEVSTIERQPERFRGTGGIGLISARLMMEGPIGGSTSWHLGGRRSYADVFLPLAKDPNVRGAALHFYDFNAKLTHRLSRRDMLQASGYYGGDVLGLVDMGRVRYGNGAASLTWRHIYNDRLLSRLSFNFSDFTLQARSEMESVKGVLRTNIRDFQLRIDFDHNPLPDLKLTYGASTIMHMFRPGSVRGVEKIDMNSLVGNNSIEYTLYGSAEHPLGKRVIVRYGARLSMFQNMGRAEVYSYDDEYMPTGSVYYPAGKAYHTDLAAEPRVGILIKTAPNSSVKASYAYNTQFMQLANNSSAGSPMDIWFSSGPNIEPQRSHLISAGYFHNLRDNMFALSAELYYKDMRHVVDFKDGADLLLNSELDGEIRAGRGYSYGLELSAAKTKGRLTGFVNYTLSRSMRVIPGINGGEEYPAPFDKPHVFNIALSYKISPRWEASVSWVYAMGNPTTYPVQRFFIGEKEVVVYSKRNAYRLPAYHRMDISVTWKPPHKSGRRWHGDWNLSIYNLYNKKNPWMVQFEQYDNGVNYGEMTYLFGIVPSITYNFKF